jgi:putative flippase GtrA
MMETLKRFAKYVTIGLSAALAYWGLLFMLTEYCHIWYMISAIISTAVTSPLAFIVHSIWTWKSKITSQKKVLQHIVLDWDKPAELAKTILQLAIVRYYIVGMAGILLDWALLFAYTDLVGLWYMFSAFIAAVIVWIITFVIRDRWISEKA